MGNIFLGLFIVSSAFSKVFCREFEVHYEVNNFDDLEKARISHDIFRRSLGDGNATSTANATKSMKTTPRVGTNPKTSFNATVHSLPTVKPITRGTQQQHNTSTTTSPVFPTTLMPTNNTNGTNITINEDNHKYYKSHYYPSGERFWFNLNNGPGTPKLHIGLTKNLQYSDTIKTKFKFPYYGHEINEVTITNKGFLFLGGKLHKFNASTQYVAPLMADFGAHLDNETTIHYVDTGDRFTVEWKNIKLQNQQAGKFSFQCSIRKSGDIIFAYKNIPVAVAVIKNNTFPVRVGLSDSFVLRFLSRPGLYIINGRLYFRIFRIVYYRYHVVKLQQKQVKSGSAFVMKPLPNCVVFKSCDSCLNSKTQFSCKWCPALQRCSDGIDRHRQSWIIAGCYKKSETTDTCPKTTKGPGTSKGATTAGKGGATTAGKGGTTTAGKGGTTTAGKGGTTTAGKGSSQKTKSRGGSSSNKRAGIAVVIVFCLLIVVAIACWLAYAYTHPLSKSGMFLMQYGNPRKWCRSEASEASGGGKITFKSMSHESTA